MQIFQNAVADEISLLGWDAVLRPGRTRQIGVPWVTINVDALVEDLFPELGFAAGRVGVGGRRGFRRGSGCG